jgi:hypothetical protein
MVDFWSRVACATIGKVELFGLDAPHAVEQEEAF